MKNLVVLVMMVLGLCVLASCGGGGGGAAAVPGNTVRGVASKGIIRNGTVKVYAVNPDGSRGGLLSETTTDASGAYRAGIGSYQGAVLVEVSGSYTDEATGATLAVAADAPLRAALDRVEGEVALAVTPLTELAVQQGEDPASHRLSLSQIAANNAAVSALFQVDIVRTMPADPLAASPSAAQGQKEYALVLAAFSKLMQTKAESLPALIAELKGGIGADNRMAAPLLSQFSGALAAFAASAANQTGVADVSATGLINIGGGTRSLSIALSGSRSLLSVVDLRITLPAGVTVKSDALGNLPAGVLGGVAQNVLAAGVLTPATPGSPGTVRIGVESAAGFAAGALLVLQYDAASGVHPLAADFAPLLLEAFDLQQAPLGGLGLSVTLN